MGTHFIPREAITDCVLITFIICTTIIVTMFIIFLILRNRNDYELKKRDKEIDEKNADRLFSLRKEYQCKALDFVCKGIEEGDYTVENAFVNKIDEYIGKIDSDYIKQ